MLESIRDASGNAMLTFLSGGKDSLAVLDLCCRVFPRVESVLMYYVRGLRCVEGSVTAAARRHNVKLHFVPHWQLSRFMNRAVFMRNTNSAVETPNISMADIEIYMKRLTGIGWIAHGHRKDESLERRGMLSSFNGINRKQQRIYPLMDWSSRDVYSYLRVRKIPPPPNFGRKTVTGINFRPETLIWMRDKFPEDFAKLEVAFPFLQASIKRKEFADIAQAIESEGEANL
jgi:phosphoadenosine phosphosulfate reductase